MRRCRRGSRTDGQHQAAAAATLAIAAVASLVLGSTVWPKETGGATHLWLGLAVQLGASAMLLGARKAPVTVALAITAVAAAIVVPGTALPGWAFLTRQSSDVWLPLSMAALATISSLLVTGRRRQLVWGLIAIVTALAAFADGHKWHASLGGVSIAVLNTAAPALIGLYIVARRQLLSALVDRAERAEREQHMLAERARAEERARIAAEMHDLVAHRVTMMVLQAGALRVTTDDDATRRTAEELRTTGCQALEELRDLLAVLHTEPSEAFPAAAIPVPGEQIAGDLAILVGESESVGTPVEVVTAGPNRSVAPVVARTVHHIVQEALSNIRKHAPGSPASVRIGYEPDGLRVSVRNRRPTSRPDPQLVACGSGSGLVGLRQRVEVMGGTFDAGPTADGGFWVEASLPASVTSQSMDKEPYRRRGRSGR